MDRFDVVEQEQLAAQIVAVMDAHFQRLTADQKRHILSLAEGQIRGATQMQDQLEQALRTIQAYGLKGIERGLQDAVFGRVKPLSEVDPTL